MLPNNFSNGEACILDIRAFVQVRKTLFGFSTYDISVTYISIFLKNSKRVIVQSRTFQCFLKIRKRNDVPYAHCSAHMHARSIILYGLTVVRTLVRSNVPTIEYQIIIVTAQFIPSPLNVTWHLQLPQEPTISNNVFHQLQHPFDPQA